jgi:hypothetical protein
MYIQGIVNVAIYCPSRGERKLVATTLFKSECLGEWLVSLYGSGLV